LFPALLPDPRPPRPATRFSGWRIVVLAAVALGMTGPGQTVGVSVFVDPMMAALELTRSQVATAYLVGTLVGAAAMPRLGRVIDDHGARVAMAIVAGLFGAVLTAMAGVVGIVTLTLGFVGIRMFGQGGLTLVSTTAVAPWFARRRGIAIGITTAVGSALLSLVPIAAASAIGWVGWRGAWLLLAAAVWVVVLPIALRGLIDRPADVGQRVDGDPVAPAADPTIPAAPATPDVAAAGADASDDDHVPGSEGPAPEVVFTRRQALRTPMFWAVASAVSATGMIGTGLAFHQIDLLGEQGLTPVQAAANFLPQTGAALLATLGIGAMVDRLAARWVLLVAMALLASAMVAVPFLAPGWTAVGYGMMVGAAGGSVRAMEAASFPKLFGVRHLGSIRGVVTSISVAATAFGPVALSLGRDLTGSYVQVLLVLLAVPVAVVVLGMLAPDPRVGAPERTG
jgi:MFS family permease